MTLAAQATGGDQAGTSLQTEYERAYEAMLADLPDPEKSFRFAELAVRVGDVNGAINALERILLLNPALDNIRLELGLLYHRVGNAAVASAYLEEALRSEDIPPDVRARAETVLAEAERAQSRHQFSGFFSAGSQYYSNVNFAPTQADVRVFDRALGRPVTATLDPRAQEEDDFNIFGSGGITYRFDLETQAQDYIEANAFAFISRFSDRSDFDLDVYQVDVGPRLAVGWQSGINLGVRPYATVSHVKLGGDRFILRYGGGATLSRFWLGERLSTELTAQYREQDFSNTTERPFAELNDGHEWLFIADTGYQLTSNDRIWVQGIALLDNGEAEFESNTDLEVRIGYTRAVRALFAFIERPWLLTLSGSYRNISFDGPDPFIDPNTTREDNEYEVSLVAEIPLIGPHGLSLLAQYTKNNSNLPNFEFDNFLGSMAFTFRF